MYDRSMVRRCASLVFGLSLLVVIDFAMSHAHPLRVPSGSTGFSTPCQPSSPAFKATGESKVVSTLDSTFSAENAKAAAGVGRGSCVGTVSRTIPSPAPGAYPPLLHRPPPANS